MGCGVEQLSGTGRTPGFSTREQPMIVRDLRGFNRLDMKRNKRDVRTIQTSLWLAQGWRANCDIQILLYDSNPDFPDSSDIARVTDYIVSYACKGNESISEERNQTAALINMESENSGDEQDLKRLARKVLNKAMGQKMISKQEAIVHGAGLKLFQCSERIETVSLSGTYKLAKNGGYGSKTMVVKYAKRDSKFSRLSFHEYFMYMKNYSQVGQNHITIIPHYVGAYHQACYPVTEEYAKSILLIHCPWLEKFNETERSFVDEFEDFVARTDCPDSVKIPYERMKQRHLENKEHVEPTSSERTECYDDFTEASPDLRDCITLLSHLSVTKTSVCKDDIMDVGENFDWHLPREPVSNITFVNL